jgi:DHA1 family bicyclomycin/chloramphenicol resistance-like MFS transporter
VVAPLRVRVVVRDRFGSWRLIALATAIFSLGVLGWSLLRLPETLHPEDRRPLTLARTAAAFRTVLTTRVSLCYTLASALIFGVLFAFINQAEQIFTQVFGLGPTFTLWFSAVAIVMSAISFTNSRLVQRFGMRRLSHTAVLGFVAFSALQLAVALTLGDSEPFWLFYVLIVPTFCCFGFMGTNFNALAMDPLGHVAGTASSVLGFCQTLGGGICGAIVGYLYDGTLVPLFAGYIVLSLSALLLVVVAEKGRLFERRYRRRLPDGTPLADDDGAAVAEATR